MNVNISDYFDPRATNRVKKVYVGDKPKGECDFLNVGSDVDEDDSDSDEDDDHNIAFGPDENEDGMAVDGTQADPGENLANEPDGGPRGFMKKEESGDLTVEDEPGTNKTYNMQLYTDDVGGIEVYTCLGKVREVEYYVRFEDLELRVDIAHNNSRLSLYKIDHGIGPDPGHPPMKYWNQFFKEIETSPFLAGHLPDASPAVVGYPPPPEEIIHKKQNTITKEIHAAYAQCETDVIGEQRKKFKKEQQSMAQQEDQTLEEHPLAHQSDAALTGGQSGGNRRGNRYRESQKLPEERTAQQKRRIQENTRAFESNPHVTSTKERKEFLSKFIIREAQEREARQRLDLITQQTKRFVKDQLLMYQSRLKNSGRASRWSAKARYRTHLPAKYTDDTPLDIYMTVRGDLVTFFKVDPEVISISDSEEIQKWLDAFRKRTMQLKFKLHYATLPTGTNHESIQTTSLKVGGDTVVGLRHYSCHPAQFYHLYVKADVLPQLRGTPVKRGNDTIYELSWDLGLDYPAMAQFLKDELRPIVDECQEVDKRPEPALKWVWRGNGNTETCLNLIKYGMAKEAKRERQQKAVMGCSATKVAKLVWGRDRQPGRSWKRTAEWLHRSGFRMGGLGSIGEEEPTQTSQTVGNLVFGTKEANTAMLRYEDAAARMVEYWERARYEALYPPDEMVHTFVKGRVLTKDDESYTGNNEYEVKWTKLSLKRFTFNQWLERSVKAGNAIQNRTTEGVNVRPDIDERLITYFNDHHLACSQDPFLIEANRLERQRELQEALRNRINYDGPQKVHPLDTYDSEHGHLITSTLTAANIPIILNLYDAIIKADILKRDLMLPVPEPEGVGPAVGKKVLDELTPEDKERWEALPLHEQHRAAVLTGWFAKTLTWDFSINFPSMYGCKTDTYDDRIRNIQWNKPVQMSTEFNLNLRHTPFMMEAQLDEQFDITLWEQGFFKATGPQWDQGGEVPFPDLGLGEKDRKGTNSMSEFEQELYKARSSTSDTEEEIYKTPSPKSRDEEEAPDPNVMELEELK